ncbi:MAG: hypothetical protein IT302_07050 [Dehalococcoidia bacterium]|nr:hypothetical protein [Dehalococcoidia bacterium]
MRTYALFGMAAMAALSLTFAACGGDDDSGDTKDSPTSAANTAATSDTNKTGAQATTAGGGTGSGTANTPTGGTLTGSGADALKAILNDFTKKSYQGSYELTVKDAGGVEQKGSLSIAFKAPKSYYSFSLGGGQPGDITVIDDGTNSLMCTKIASAGQCQKSKSGPNTLFANPLSLAELEKNLSGSTKVTQIADQKVAGEDAKCFQMDDTKGITCFTKKDGLLAKSDISMAGSKVTLVATKLSTTVDEKLFEAPAGYNVTTMP